MAEVMFSYISAVIVLLKCITVRNIFLINCDFSAVHLSVIHCQRMAAENLLSVLSTLPSNMAVNDRNDLLQVTNVVLAS